MQSGKIKKNYYKAFSQEEKCIKENEKKDEFDYGADMWLLHTMKICVMNLQGHITGKSRHRYKYAAPHFLWAQKH